MTLRTVLVVDDKEIDRQIFRRCLQDDYTVLEANNGQEALDIFGKNSEAISAILLDIIMPVMDGYQVLETMRSADVTSKIPIIVLTVDSDVEAERKALALGANDFVSKPIDSDILRRRLHNAIEQRESAAAVNALYRDELTGLLNRQAFFDIAAEMIEARPESYYILSSIDIDNFKVINDVYGSAKGDEVLVSYAEQISRDCEDGGLCGRIAADNLITLIPAHCVPMDKEEQDRRAQLRQKNIVMPVTISVGRYIVNDKSLDVTAMYDRAKIAQSSVKRRYDKHIAVFEESMRSKLLREQEIVDEMQTALEKGQFVPWFQPQYNHATGALIGAEALARWEHPERGLISPGEFIPVFERYGFIYELDKCIWRQVCERLRKWIDEGREPLPVSVNISRYDLFHEELANVLHGLIAQYHIPADLLRLEITESAFAESSKSLIKAVKQLIDIGFTAEIDDFGSGYSSLNTLKDVPAHVLKLDMRFLETSDDELGTTSAIRGGNILESIVRMSKWLGMGVIAEGVEEAAQADYLKSIGCNYIQGFYYARPMPVHDYEVLSKVAVKERTRDTIEMLAHFDNNEFWDPKSLDTLMFNSYVGAACIFEYHEQSVFLLRMTDAYENMLNALSISVEDAMTIDWFAHVDEETSSALKDALIKEAALSGQVPKEIVFTGLPGHPEPVFLRSTLRLIASAGNRHMVYCISEDITAQRKAERQMADVTQRLQAIMTGINDGVSAVISRGYETEYLFANERFYSMLGYTVKQFNSELSNGLRDLVLPEDMQSAEERYSEHMKANGVATNTFRVRRRDGSVIWLRASGSVCHFEGVEDPVNLAVYSDITQQKQAEYLLQKNYDITAENMRAIMDSVDGGIVATTFHEIDKPVNIFANDLYYSMLGYTKEQFETELSTPLDAIHPDDLASTLEIVSNLLETGGKAAYEYRCIKRDGSVIWVRNRNTVTEMGEAGESVLLGVITDITQEKASGEIERNRLLAALSTVYPVLIRVNLTQDSYEIVMDDQGIVHLDSPKGRISDMERSVASRMHADVAKRYLRSFNKDEVDKTLAKAGDSVRFEYLQQIDGVDVRWLELTAIRIKNDFDDDIVGVVACRPIDAQKEMEEKLRQAERDKMTGIYNRATTEALASEKLASSNDVTCALLLVDLDDLKGINDRFGHSAGDRAIALVANQLRKQFRHSDIVGRVGGDEFVVFLRDVSRKTLETVIPDIMNKISTLRVGSEDDYALSCSIGIAFGDSTDTYIELFDKADKALYHNKRTVKGEFAFYRPEMG